MEDGDTRLFRGGSDIMVVRFFSLLRVRVYIFLLTPYSKVHAYDATRRIFATPLHRDAFIQRDASLIQQSEILHSIFGRP